MTWFLLSLISALGLATADALTKRFFSDLSPYRMGVSRILAIAPWMILSLFVLPSAVPDQTFWLAIATALPLELTAFFLTCVLSSSHRCRCPCPSSPSRRCS